MCIFNGFLFFAVENIDGSIAKQKKKFIHPKKTAEERKLEKEKRKLRKARIILRNLPFKITEDELNKVFSKFGPVKECNILKREDGKLVGCAFIQYDKVNHAAKAIHHANGKDIAGRQVIIDWAVNQKKFSQHVRQEKQKNPIGKIKTEDEIDGIKIKEESDDESDQLNSNDAHGSDAESNDESEGESDDDGENSEGSEELDEDASENEVDEKKPIHKKSNDVAEGCTVFIKNIPFESTNDDLYKVCRQFGPLNYAVITVDRVSGHSKGNGFAKYKVFM